MVGNYKDIKQILSLQINTDTGTIFIPMPNTCSITKTDEMSLVDPMHESTDIHIDLHFTSKVEIYKF